MPLKELLAIAVVGWLILTGGGVVMGLMTPPAPFSWRVGLIVLGVLDVAMIYMAGIGLLVRWLLA